MTIKILNRFTSDVIFECEADSMKMAVEMACRQKISLINAYLYGANLNNANPSNADLTNADLSNANLSNADLTNANLSYANLYNADLYNANLTYADLTDARLYGADLRNADLSNANLSGANLNNAHLSYADLSYAKLSNADLTDARLYGADLSYVDLSGADLRYTHVDSVNLSTIKADFIDVISQSPHEVPELIRALEDGRVDGLTYRGECSCLVGTIAKARGIDVDSPEFDIKKNACRPAERFFLAIRKGDKPENNPVSKIALEWAKEWFDAFDRGR